MAIISAYVQEGPSNTWLGLEILELNSEFSNINQGSDNIFFDSSELECQCAIGGAECGNGLTILCSVSSNIFNVIDLIFLVYGIGGMVAST